MVQAKTPQSAFTTTRLLWILLGGLLTVAVLTSLSDFHQVATALSRSDLLLTTIAFGLVLLYALNLAEFYRSIFQAGGLKAGPLRFVLISSASHFINLVSKTSGFGGLALYLGEARRQGDSAARVGAAYLAAYVLGYVAYLSVLISALVLLYVRGALTTVEITASSVILVIVAAIASLLVIGLRSERYLQAMLLFAVGLVNRATRLLGKPLLISMASASNSAKELHGSLQAVIARPSSYVRPFGHALGVEVLSALMLFVVARSLGVDIGLEVALAGYAITLLFAILSVTPAGLGFVEVSLTIFLVSFGVSKPDAIAVTLAYRFFDFWLPVALGAACLAILKVQNASSSSK